MDHLNSNLELLKSHHTQAYSALLEFYKSQQSHPTRAELRKFPSSNEYNLNYVDEFQQTKSLYSIEPSKHWETCIKHAKNINSCKILFIFGLGLGYHISKIIEEYGHQIKHFVIIEKQPIVAAQALKIEDCKSWLLSDKVTFYIHPNLKNSLPLIKQYFLDKDRLIYSNQMGFFYHLPSLNHDGPFYVEFTRNLELALSQLQNIFKAPSEDNVAALDNIVKNAPKLDRLNSLLSSRSSLKDMPALLIGAGPSLDDMIPTLQRIQNQIYTCAVDAALPTLLQHNIIPDFVVCAERVHQQSLFFENLPDSLSTTLITLPTSHPKVLNSFKNNILLLARNATYGAWLSKDFSIPMGLGVSTVAFQALSCLGCNPIYLIGQNFAYSRKNQNAYTTSDLDYLNHLKDTHAENDIIEVVGNDNTPIKTHTSWNVLKDELNEHIQQTKTSVFNVISKNEGALIPATQNISPEEFQNKTIEFSEKKFWFHSDTPKHESATQKIKTTISYLEKLHLECLKGMKALHNDFFQTINAERNPSQLKDTIPDWVAQWNKIQNDLIDIDRDLFYFFTNLTFAAQNMVIMIERENLNPKTLSPYSYLFKYCFKTIEWIQILDGWVIRLKDVLQNT